MDRSHVMVGLKAAAVAALLSGLALTPVVAQSFSEPAAFAAAHPNRDVLNGGALTPAGAAALAGTRSPYEAMGRANLSACQSYRSYDPVSGTFVGRHGRRQHCG
jgi:BA14K-like protein